MSPRPRPYGARAVRPALERLENRELLSMGPALQAEISPFARPKRVPTIAQLPTAPQRTVSTVPSNGDVNPYGIVFIPPGFRGSGALKPGDILVSNFNNSKNQQGTGSTIVDVSRNGRQSLYFQDTSQSGLDTALGVLSRGFVIVGNVPGTYDSSGNLLSVGQGSLRVLDRTGKVVATLSDSQFLDGPWDLTVNDRGSTAQIFVSTVLSGTITRIDVKLPRRGGFQVVRMTQIASGYLHRPDSAAFEIGPTGLVYSARTGTLYVASTGDNAIFAIRNAGKATTDQGMGTPVYQDATHLHGPLGLVLAPDGNFIAAQGDAINSDPTQPSELVEFTPGGKFIGQFSLSSDQGGAFGVATSAPSQRQFAAVNDITNAVQVWRVKS